MITLATGLAEELTGYVLSAPLHPGWWPAVVSGVLSSAALAYYVARRWEGSVLEEFEEPTEGK